jgi:hypothetical protein
VQLAVNVESETGEARTVLEKISMPMQCAAANTRLTIGCARRACVHVQQQAGGKLSQPAKVFAQVPGNQSGEKKPAIVIEKGRGCCANGIARKKYDNKNKKEKQ